MVLGGFGRIPANKLKRRNAMKTDSFGRIIPLRAAVNPDILKRFMSGNSLGTSVIEKKEEESPVLSTVWTVASIAGAGAGAYHGYKRNNSVWWGFGWFLLGGLLPVLTLPLSYAQGFGQEKK